MGFFNNIIKKLAGSSISKEIKNMQARDKEYVSMSTDQLKELSEVDLLSAAIARAENKANMYDNLLDGINSLSEPLRVTYVVYYLEVEVYNGGLSQFCINSSGATAPLVSESLGKISAFEHKKLYDDFTKNRILDADNPLFDDTDFDEYDNAFYELKPPSEYLYAYARKHVEQL